MKDSNGYVNPGELVAILGPSGSGKTSLLNILSSRHTVTQGFNLTGHCKANGRELKFEEFSKFGAYVPQDDQLMITETPTELFTFATKLRTNYDD